MAAPLSLADRIRAEVIAELRAAFASHDFRCDPSEDPEICLTCRQPEDDAQHLGRRSSRAAVAEILGDIPISTNIIGHRYCLVIDPTGVAEHLAHKAGLTDTLGYPVAVPFRQAAE